MTGYQILILTPLGIFFIIETEMGINSFARLVLNASIKLIFLNLKICSRLETKENPLHIPIHFATAVKYDKRQLIPLRTKI